ncbi:MAG: hypothetical protein JKY34_13545 [Kordiimonadaceae bacterium]|nr:hypothetical protein [Kordiimonadaceae bacterium]
MSIAVNVHYEILGRRGHSWTILEVIKNRKDATKKATVLWEAKQYTGVRIIKESYNKENHEFLSVEIFSRGSSAKKSKHDQTGQITPCLTPDDLYNADGRNSIWQLMQNSLAEWRITPTELLHNLEHYYKLYNTGTKLQDAVQRTAVSFDEEELSIQERMRKIYKMIDAAVEVVKSNESAVPSLEMGRLKPVIDGLEKIPNKKFLLTAGIVDYLKPTVTLSDKFGRVAVFLSNRHPPWVIGILDQLLSELLQHPTVLDQLLGDHEHRDAFIMELAHMQAGHLKDLVGKPGYKKINSETLRLSGFLAEENLPLTAHILLNRVKAEIAAPKPINNNGLVAQLTSLHNMLDTFRAMEMGVHAIDTLSGELAARASRLINSQSISDLIAEHENPIAKVNALLDLEAATLGSSNKRTVANFILPILSRPEHEVVFMGLDNQPIQRMNELVALQKKVMGADLTEMHRRQIAEKLDEFCRNILDNTQILKKIHKLPISLQEKTDKILGMMAEGYFTDGDCYNRAEQQVRVYMKQDGFTEGLINGLNRSGAEQRLLAFKDLLLRAGIQGTDDEVETAASESTPPESKADDDDEEAAALNDEEEGATETEKAE